VWRTDDFESGMSFLGASINRINLGLVGHERTDSFRELLMQQQLRRLSGGHK
jgi:hypothetical protein